jgi:hypothetical protein
MNRVSLASAIRKDLAFSLATIWSERARGIPPWVGAVTSENSIQRVLNLAHDATVELGVPPGIIYDIAPDELSAYWTITFRELYEQELPRQPVSPDNVEFTIAKRVSTAVFSMNTQSTRYRNFLRFGPPPGVRELPQFTGSERTKTHAVPWEMRRTSAQANRSKQYMACIASQPRRMQSLRSSHCTESDVLNPGHFM